MALVLYFHLVMEGTLGVWCKLTSIISPCFLEPDYIAQAGLELIIFLRVGIKVSTMSNVFCSFLWATSCGNLWGYAKLVRYMSSALAQKPCSD